MRILNNKIVISISNTMTYVKEIIVLKTPSKCSASERVFMMYKCMCVHACGTYVYAFI